MADGIKRELQVNDFFKLGRHSFLVSIFMTLMLLNQIGIILYMSFAGSTPRVISCGEHDFSNITDQIDVCVTLREIQKTENCTPEFEAMFQSLNLEWGYYCENAKTVKKSITYQMIGLMIGAIVFGQVSDIFGRKPTLLVTIFMANILNIAASFTTSLFWFSVIYFFVNIFNAGGFAVLPIFALEMIRPKDRLWISNLFGGNPVIILYASLAYFCGYWRTLARMSSALTIPAIILCLFISESPRYLIQKGKIAKAKAVLKCIHRIDGRQFREEIVDYVLDKENKICLEKQSEKQYGFTHLFYTPNLTRYTLCISLSFFTTSVIVFGLMFNMEKISGSIYLNLLLSGCLRYIIGAIIALIEIKWSKLGRKTIHFCKECYQVKLARLLQVMTMIILGFLAQTFFLNSICITELFPTSIRNKAYAFGALFNRFGITCAPQLFFMAEYWKPLPFLAMFSLVFFVMILYQFNVTETRGSPLGDYMPGPEESWSGRRKAKNQQQPLPISLSDLKSEKSSQILINRGSARFLDRTESFMSVSGI